MECKPGVKPGTALVSRAGGLRGTIDCVSRPGLARDNLTGPTSGLASWLATALSTDLSRGSRISSPSYFLDEMQKNIST